jgi:hypothetical protein
MGGPEETVFRHTQNDWVDWTQSPNVLKADYSVEQRGSESVQRESVTRIPRGPLSVFRIRCPSPRIDL